MGGAVASIVMRILLSVALYPPLNAAAVLPRLADTQVPAVPPAPEPADVVAGDCGCAPAPLPPEPGTPVELRCVWTLLPGPVEIVREESIRQSHISATLANCLVPEIDSQEVKFLVPSVQKVSVSSTFSRKIQERVNCAALDALELRAFASLEFEAGQTSSYTSKGAHSVGCKLNLPPCASVALDSYLIVDIKVVQLPMGHKWVVSWYRNGAWTPWQTHSVCEGQMGSVTATSLRTRLSGCESKNGPPCEDCDASPGVPQSQPKAK